MSFEERPRPDVAVSLFNHWLCYRWDCSVSAAKSSDSTGHGAMEGTENWGCLFFFLVQYAVHKSLALEILHFLFHFCC